jgi:hypothetical protein
MTKTLKQNKMKQTAVEWLVEQMIERKFFDKNTPLSFTTLEHLANKAKEMEKEQIKDAVRYGCSDWGSAKEPEQYYNENFKSERDDKKNG